MISPDVRLLATLFNTQSFKYWFPCSWSDRHFCFRARSWPYLLVWLRRALSVVTIICEKPFCCVTETTALGCPFLAYGFLFFTFVSTVKRSRFFYHRRSLTITRHGLCYVETVAGFRTPYVQTDEETKVYAYEHIAFQFAAEQLQVRVCVAAFRRWRRTENHGR